MVSGARRGDKSRAGEPGPWLSLMIGGLLAVALVAGYMASANGPAVLGGEKDAGAEIRIGGGV